MDLESKSEPQPEPEPEPEYVHIGIVFRDATDYRYQPETKQFWGRYRFDVDHEWKLVTHEQALRLLRRVLEKRQNNTVVR